MDGESFLSLRIANKKDGKPSRTKKNEKGACA